MLQTGMLKPKIIQIINFIAALLFVATLSGGNAAATVCQSEPSSEIGTDLLVKTNIVGVGVITGWGVAKWDYFSKSPNTVSEGWFSAATKSGGADKLGHMYTSYVTTHGLSYFYETRCFNKEDAAFYGALSSFAIMTYMEFGDSFSDIGFSHEDFISNVVGITLGNILYKNAELSKKVDIRWEYGLHRDKGDFTTDYENSKYLVALKFSGFESTRSGLLRYLELHGGYYTRGFSNPAHEKERNSYLGVGINLSELLRERSYKKTATFFNYIQIPGTYVAIDRHIGN
jgi:hypothetical protein